MHRARQNRVDDRLSLQRTIKSVIPSPEGAWESPVIQMLSVVITGDCHGLQASLAMTVVFDAWPHKRSFIYICGG